MFSKRIIEFGEKFKNRLDSDTLKDDLGYVEFGESALAFDTLCTHLMEHDVSLSADEYDEMMELAKEMELDTDGVEFEYLKNIRK